MSKSFVYAGREEARLEREDTVQSHASLTLRHLHIMEAENEIRYYNKENNKMSCRRQDKIIYKIREAADWGTHSPETIAQFVVLHIIKHELSHEALVVLTSR